jgi:hypothetical protein
MNFAAGAYLYVSRSGQQFIAIVEWVIGRSRVRFFTLAGKPATLKPQRTGRPKQGHLTLDAVLANGYMVPLVPHDWKWRNGHHGMESVTGPAGVTPALAKHTGVQHYYVCLDRESGYCEIRWHEAKEAPVTTETTNTP